jgi:hypothetical protein
MLGYNTIERFLNKIHETRNKTVEGKYISLWVREILVRQPDTETLKAVQTEIEKNGQIPLKVSVICDLIELHQKKAKKVLDKKIKIC